MFVPGNTLVGLASPFGQIEDALEGMAASDVDEMVMESEAAR